MIKTGGVALEVPLADDRGLVAALLKLLRKGRLRSIKAAVAVVEENENKKAINAVSALSKLLKK